MSSPPKFVKCHPASKKVVTLLVDGCGKARMSEGNISSESWLSKMALKRKEGEAAQRWLEMETWCEGDEPSLNEPPLKIDSKLQFISKGNLKLGHLMAPSQIVIKRLSVESEGERIAAAGRMRNRLKQKRSK
jgi:hypothetical protein